MNKYLILFLIFSFIHANSIFAWIFGDQIFQVLALILLALLTIINAENKVSFSVIVFCVCCFLSICANTIPEIFRPWSRLFQFVLLLTAVSPLFQGENISFIRHKTIETIVVSFIAITIASFMLYFSGGGISAVGYFGYAQHPNFLGFFAMMSTVSLLALFLVTNKINKRVIFIILFLASFIIAMLASSRTCLGATIVGCIILIFLEYKKSLSKMFVVVVSVIALAIVAFPLYESYLGGIMYKQDSAEKAGSTTSSRDALWATRIYEFNKSPIFGIGCFAVDTSIQSEEDDPEAEFYNPYNAVTGSVELGSSYLGLLSQLGIIGFLAFIVIFIKSFYRCYETINKTESIYPKWLFALGICMSIHMIFEGYVVQAGTIMCTFLWCLLACMQIPYDIMEEEEDYIIEKLQLIHEDNVDDADEDEEIEYDD